MLFEFLQFGYIGLLGLLLFLSYRLIDSFHKSSRPFSQTILLIFMFLLISIIGGAAGYFWADKELEVAQTKKSTASIIETQINIARLRMRSTQELLNSNLNLALQNSELENAKLVSELIKQNELSYQHEVQVISESIMGAGK